MVSAGADGYAEFMIERDQAAANRRIAAVDENPARSIRNATKVFTDADEASVDVEGRRVPRWYAAARIAADDAGGNRGSTERRLDGNAPQAVRPRCGCVAVRADGAGDQIEQRWLRCRDDDAIPRKAADGQPVHGHARVPAAGTQFQTVAVRRARPFDLDCARPSDVSA